MDKIHGDIKLNILLTPDDILYATKLKVWHTIILEQLKSFGNKIDIIKNLNDYILYYESTNKELKDDLIITDNKQLQLYNSILNDFNLYDANPIYNNIIFRKFFDLLISSNNVNDIHIIYNTDNLLKYMKTFKFPKVKYYDNIENKMYDNIISYIDTNKINTFMINDLKLLKIIINNYTNINKNNDEKIIYLPKYAYIMFNLKDYISEKDELLMKKYNINLNFMVL